MKQKFANGCLVIEDAFVDLDSAQRDRMTPFAQSVKHRQELLAVAHAGSAAVHSHFKQHIQSRSALREVRSKLVDLLGRVNQAVKLKRRIAQQFDNDRHVLLADELIGHEHAANAVRVGNLRLMRRSQGDAPGARSKLQVKQVWRHGGLSVRSQPDAVRGRELPHPLKIVLQRIFIEHRCGQREILAQQVPVVLRNLLAGNRTFQQSNALIQRVDPARNAGYMGFSLAQLGISNPAVSHLPQPCKYDGSSLHTQGAVMSTCDTLIRKARVYDDSGADPEVVDVALLGDHIAAIGPALSMHARSVVEAEGLALAPGFIDTHTHDDLSVIQAPAMEPKISQGVTTIIAGNCGISAASVTLHGVLPDPMNLLGDAAAFRYPTFAAYKAAIQAAAPAVNVATLVGHTALRNNVMDRLDRPATGTKIEAMKA